MFLITIYVHVVTLRSLLWLRGAVCRWGLQAWVGMVSILLGGAGLGTTSKDGRTFARGVMGVFCSCDIVGGSVVGGVANDPHTLGHAHLYVL